MKRAIFICSHIHSGSATLYESLDKHPKIQGFRTGNVYLEPLDLLSLTNRPHKLDNRSAIYMDELLYNHVFCLKESYPKCQFIYVIREPEPVLKLMVSEGKSLKFAVRHYAYRLRRLCEMARRTPGAVLLTWEDLRTGRGIPLVENYLGLKFEYDPSGLSYPERDVLDHNLLNEAQDTYERYFYFLTNCGLSSPGIEPV